MRFKWHFEWRAIYLSLEPAQLTRFLLCSTLRANHFEGDEEVEFNSGQESSNDVNWQKFWRLDFSEPYLHSALGKPTARD